MSSDDMFTDELPVLESLVSAWNQFVNLPDHRFDDLVDFRRAIHEAERILAVRAIRRVRPDISGSDATPN